MRCTYCGTDLPEKALFCGECGRSLAQSSARPGSTAPVAVPLVREPVAFASPSEGTTETAIIDLVDELPKEAEPARAPDTIETLSVWDAPALEAAEPWAPPARLLNPEVESIEDLDETRIVTSTLGGHRFVLQFSTGESVTIFGTGLIGRNPAPEPSEYFDQLVAIVDPGKSVSKTHLEFGQVAGSFWVSDRYSGNGTVVREPDSDPKRCEPGKRYRVARGTRVTMGEQFFVVS